MGSVRSSPSGTLQKLQGEDVKGNPVMGIRLQAVPRPALCPSSSLMGSQELHEAPIEEDLVLPPLPFSSLSPSSVAAFCRA